MNKNVVCFIDDLCPGGAQRQLVGLASLLKSKGYKVTLITYHDNNFYLPFLNQHEIEYVYVEKAENSLKRIYAIYGVMRRLSPDVIISYLESPNIISCILKLFLPTIKLIVSERNTSQKKGLSEFLRFSLYRFADYIVPNSHSQAHFISTNYGGLRRKVHTITNFVDTNLFKPNYKLNQRVNNILSVGRITPQKNIITYIQVAKNVVEKHPTIIFDWYGDTDNPIYENECLDMVKRLNLENNFIFHSAEKNIIPIYQSSGVFCLPSIYEGFPNVVCEAMSCGMPILCSDVCDNPIIVSDSYNGFLFNPKSIHEIAEAINRCIEMPQSDLDEMRDRSRKIAEDIFSADSMVDQYIKLIES